MDTHRAIARAARDSCDRLITFQAVRSRDVAAGEALAGAFLAALETCPRTGVPEKPGAWLLTVAQQAPAPHP